MFHFKGDVNFVYYMLVLILLCVVSVYARVCVYLCVRVCFSVFDCVVYVRVCVCICEAVFLIDIRGGMQVNMINLMLLREVCLIKYV